MVCTILTITSGSFLNYVDANVGMDGAMGGDADSEGIRDVIGGEADSESGGSDDGDENEIPFTQIYVSGDSCEYSELQSGNEEGGEEKAEGLNSASGSIFP